MFLEEPVMAALDRLMRVLEAGHGYRSHQHDKAVRALFAAAIATGVLGKDLGATGVKEFVLRTRHSIACVAHLRMRPH